ncbi:MAG: hypothetical protein ABI877_21820, partial [Gemmatimonadaceae bacterium]
MQRVRCCFLMVALTACADSVSPVVKQFGDGDFPVADVVSTSDGPHYMPLRTALGTQQAATPQALNITYHGGRVLSNPNVAVIYWSRRIIYNGGPAVNTTGAGASDGSLVGYYVRNLGTSAYWNINTTYTDNTGAHVPNSLNYTQYWATDTLAPPVGVATSVPDSKIRKGIVYAFQTGRLTYDPQTIYAVLSDSKTNLGGGFGSYCAYHDMFVWRGKKVVYAVMPFQADFANGCTLLQGTSPNNDFNADAEVDTFAHELEESATDPDLNAWFDAQGAENADKCVTFYTPIYITPNGGRANMVIGTKDFLTQG